ncbi:lipopolysaccharide biosynthesis protein [Flavobacterium sp. CBA20B-1]|uniref:lipopolysaccharide biosynthesis protein n=1 Tax=unclassified Flavobacterium TaxID=196869 RepID=UPI002224001F|nr:MULTISPECIES: lipopolysaccharide biosynthesis protein [unclassified Flavobacterium]WCM42245.1 lipopolysaccharide biosynthesis protein [Flavobacterium sp. CBA20B-1]
MEKNNLNKSIKKGVVWTGLDFVGKAGLQFLLQLILAKLLVPSDFGIIGMAMVFSVIIQAFVDFGFASALIQMSEKEITEKTYNTAFWTGFGLNIIVYLLLCLIIGPIAANFYNEPILIKVFPILSLNIIFNSFNIIQLVKLTRNLEFNKLAAVNFIGNLIACVVSVIMAYNGFGLWSIAINGAVISLSSLPIYFYFNRWFPKFLWSKEEFDKIFGFGVFATGTQLTNSVTSQIDYLLIGKLVDKHHLGLYAFSFQITSIIRSAVVGIISKVMYPIYAKIRDDKKALRNYYGQIVKFNTLTVSSIMIILFLYSEHLLQLVYGNKWNEAIDIIQILSISSIVTVMAGSNTSLIRALGYASLEFKIQLFKTIIIYIPSIILGTYFYGIVGTAWSIVFNGVASVIIAMYFMRKLIGFNYYDLIKSIYKTALICLIIYVVYLFLKNNFVISIIISITLIFILSSLAYKKELQKLKL